MVGKWDFGGRACFIGERKEPGFGGIYGICLMWEMVEYSW